jgi:hypothetical protein
VQQDWKDPQVLLVALQDHKVHRVPQDQKDPQVPLVVEQELQVLKGLKALQVLPVPQVQLV